MKRDLASLTEKEFDLIVIGGGIFGVCAAWEASLRGLKVAIVEKEDFGHATSANCFKIVHGGIRYVQHGDIPRIRESSRERNILLRIAPHLVQPLPIVIPTYGHGMKGKEALFSGLALYNLIAFDRNRGLKDPARRIPFGRILSKKECLARYPGLKQEGLTGAVLFYDARIHSPQRLVFSILRSAVEAGAVAANYLEAVNLIKTEGRVVGVRCRDSKSGNLLEINGKVVLNAAGPWAGRFLDSQGDLKLKREPTFSRDACFVVHRPLIKDSALAVQGKHSDPDAVLSRGSRHLFVVPWRGHTLVGVWHKVFGGSPEEVSVSEGEIQRFIDEMNWAYPSFNLRVEDVSVWNAGLVLFGENRPDAVDLSYGKRSILIDHSIEHGVEGILTMIGVRFTTARGVGKRAIDLVFKKLKKKPLPSKTDQRPVWGGEIENWNEFARTESALFPNMENDVLAGLFKNYGSRYKEIIKFAGEDPILGEKINGSHVLKAEVIHAAREEMAVKLSDVVFRRTELGSGHYPGRVALEECASLMGTEAGWSKDRIQKEIQEVEDKYPAWSRSSGNGARHQKTSPPGTGVLSKKR